MESKLKGGKTAPKLLIDLDQYDPHNQIGHFNLLTEVPKYENDQWVVDPTPPNSSCRHKWTLDTDHTNLPPFSLRTTTPPDHWVVVHCLKCRAQLSILLSLSSSRTEQSCPTANYPLHHFLHQSQFIKSQNALHGHAGSAESRDVQEFSCTSPLCNARLQIVFHPRRLVPTWVRLLTDPELIRYRADQAIASDPERLEGHNAPSGAEVLSNLRAYLLNALKSPELRVIKGNNKRWMLSLGEHCVELLEYLGFEKQGDDWACLVPGPVNEPPTVESLRNRLNHVEKEISILLTERPSEERRIMKVDPYYENPSAALKKLLGISNYKTRPGWQPTGPTEEDHPFYASLGVVGDLHDELIVFAYDRQVTVDPHNLAYYLECLQGICDGRKDSEDLQTKVLMEQTADKFSERDFRAAYRHLGVTANLDDDTILGSFQARLVDSPAQEEDLRGALKLVGISRGSKRLQEAASTEIETYEQAMSYLGALPESADDLVVATYAVKVHEHPLEEPKAHEAMRLIAEHRDSVALRAWCNTGELGEVDMDVENAYNRLNITNRTVDDDLVLVAYRAYVSDTPSQLTDLKKALKVIAIFRKSSLLLNEVGTDITLDEHSIADWPVGLENIGNTCYLNSLLQSYFTIKPLRDLVLDFEQYRMPLDARGLASKQVGSRQVLKQEVERAQKFAWELQKLFDSMITAPKTEVKPEQELARLTLMSSTTEEQVRRRSTLLGPRPLLGEINGEAIIGPLPPPSSQEAQQDFEMIDSPALGNEQPIEIDGNPGADDSSSGTLVEISVPGEEDAHMDGMEDVIGVQQSILDDKENLPPTKEGTVRSVTPDSRMVPLNDASPSRANKQARTQSPDRDNEVKDSDIHMKPSLPPPNRPPPVPPRPAHESKLSIQEQLEIGAQQDVTEVIGNVLFQIQCAIKPESHDDNGEQIDRVKNLFYGKLKSNTTNQAGKERSNEAFFSDIKVNVFSDPPPPDIYAALDGAFDEQDVEIGGAVEPQYTTISLLPPILQVHINRTDFDRAKQTNVKSNHLFDFQDILYMDRYLDLANDDLVKRRTQKWTWKKQLSNLEARQKQMTEDNVTESIALLRDLTQNINGPEDKDPIFVPESLLEGLEAESSRCMEEAQGLSSQIAELRASVETQFSDQKNVCYRLHSVFIHRGGATSGHYWIYIYDFEQKIWRKYNDGYVTKVDATEVFGHDPSKPPATPYFLTYIKDGLQSQLVNCVHRNPVEPLPALVEDTVMEDVIPSVEIEYSNDAAPDAGMKSKYVAVTEWDSTESKSVADWLEAL